LQAGYPIGSILASGGQQTFYSSPRPGRAIRLNVTSRKLQQRGAT
jgi:hypothetical protein